MYALKKRLLSPMYFYQFSRRLLPILMILWAVLIVYGIIGALVLVPLDYQQGDAFRIIYVHVPAAFTAMFIYICMAVFAFISYIWRIKLATLAMFASASIGAWITFLALVTGAIWGKPTWGTWWIWDARLTSVLILFFLYLGFLALESAIEAAYYREKVCALLAIIGVINLPVVHYSVIWWNTLHQGPTLAKFQLPSIDNSMLYPLLAMILAFNFFYWIILFLKIQTALLLKPSNTAWLKRIYGYE